MNDGTREDWVGDLLRGVLIGSALGIVTSAGMALVLAQVVAAPSTRLTVLVTALVAFAVGIWAGKPEGEARPPRPRHRWLHAGAPTAVAGAYASFSTLYQQAYPGSVWGLASLVMAIAVPAYAIGLLPPSLMAWRFPEREDNEEAAPLEAVRQLALGVLMGAAAGALVASLLLLPIAGPGSLLMGAAAILLLPLAIPDRSPTTRETTLFETVSPFGLLRVTEVVFPGERQPERKLYLNDEEESGELSRSGAPTLPYIAAAESLLATITPQGASYLFLGGGAYTLPRRLLERDSRASAVVVELDPEVTRIAYQYFHVSPRHAITPVHGDARAYLESEREARFDRIYVDVYSGQEALPYSLVTVEAARTMLHRLSAGGIVAMNLIGVVSGEEIRQPWSIIKSFAEVFPTIAVYSHFGQDYPDAQNLLLVAAATAGQTLPRTAGTFDLWPREEWPSPAGLIAFHDLFGKAPDAAVPSPTPATQAARAGERRV